MPASSPEAKARMKAKLKLYATPEYHRAWRVKNRERVREHRFNEKLRKLGLDPKLYNPKGYKKKVLVITSSKCKRCGKCHACVPKETKRKRASVALSPHKCTKPY